MVPFIESTEMNMKTSDLNCLSILILLNKMGWYLGVIVKLHNDECSIYIFTWKVENGTQIVFNKHCIFIVIKNEGITFHVY